MQYLDQVVLHRPFKCRAELSIMFRSLGLSNVPQERSMCDSCNSLGCPSSPRYVPVARWRCYPKKFENHGFY